MAAAKTSTDLEKQETFEINIPNGAKIEKFQVWEHVTRCMPFLADGKTMKIAAWIAFSVLLLGSVTVGAYFFNFYSTHGKPNYDDKWNLASGCINAIDKEIAKYVLQQYQFERYPPENPEALNIVDQNIKNLMQFKKNYYAVKDDLYNYNPELVFPLVWLAYYVAFAIVLSFSSCVFDKVDGAGVAMGILSVFFLSIFVLLCYAMILDMKCPVFIGRN